MLFPEPVTPTRRIAGLDGQAKMSKSIGNTIGLLETPEQVWEKLRPAVTDPARQRKTDAGDPEKCPVVFPLHKAFSPPETVAEVEAKCRGAGWGCMDCKKSLHAHMMEELTPIRTRAAELQARPQEVDELLADGARRARTVARQTMDTVRKRMGLSAAE